MRRSREQWVSNKSNLLPKIHVTYLVSASFASHTVEKAPNPILKQIVYRGCFCGWLTHVEGLGRMSPGMMGCKPSLLYFSKSSNSL